MSLTCFGNLCVLSGVLKKVPSTLYFFCSPRIPLSVLQKFLFLFHSVLHFQLLLSVTVLHLPLCLLHFFFHKIAHTRNYLLYLPSIHQRIWLFKNCWHVWSDKIHSNQLTLVYLLILKTVHLCKADLVTLKVQTNEHLPLTTSPRIVRLSTSSANFSTSQKWHNRLQRNKAWKCSYE